jgi:hypothetical protein
MNRLAQAAVVVSLFTVVSCGVSDLEGEELGSVSEGLGSIVDFPATRDAIVAADRPATNFGADAVLSADASPQRQSLIRFVVRGLPVGASIVSANVRIFATNSTHESGELHRVLGAWSEGSVTWSTRPSSAGRLASIRDEPTSGGWRIANVAQDVTGSGTYDFYLLTSSAERIQYASSESSNAPILRVKYIVSSDGGAWTDGGAPTDAGLACASDFDCPYGTLCHLGVCRAGQPNGAACTSDDECVSNACIGGSCGGYNTDGGFHFDAGTPWPPRDAGTP